MAIKKNRAALNEERNKKIKDMDMEEVRHYLCMKNGQNPDKCEGCLGLSSCTAGQRVMVLKAEQEQRAAEEQKEAVPKKKRNYSTARSERTKEYIKQVVAADDPRAFLMEHEGLTFLQARKKLENWRMRHPDMFNGVSWPVKHENKNPSKRHRKPEEKENQKMEDDVSVEDFLNAMDVNEATKATPEKDGKPSASGVGIWDELRDKFNDLCEQRDKLLISIHDLEDQVAGVQRTIDAIRLTAHAFGLELE